MPPAAKFNREEIVAAAFQLVRKEGMRSLTARALADALGSSPRPIFTVFDSIADVKDAVMEDAYSLYRTYIDEGLRRTPPFKGAGMASIRFAAEEPQLYHLLFLQTEPVFFPLSSVHVRLDPNYELILHSLTDFYGISREDGIRLYAHLGIYTHGIATYIATGMAAYEEEEISRQLTEVFSALLTALKGKGTNA